MLRLNDETFTAALPENPDHLPGVSLDESHSPLKVLAHSDLLRKFVEGESFNPVHMRIGITGACNMRCNFCNFHSSYETQFYDRFSYKDSIATDKAVVLMRQFALNGGRAVTFCGSGECTTHPGYVEICQQAFGKGLRLGLITNGTRLHKSDVADCIKQTHTWVRIGMNAGTPETFARITHHRPESFGRLLGAIRDLRVNAADPEFRIGLNYVITLENYAEVTEAARLAGESGAHYVRFEPEFYSALGHETIEQRMDEIAERLRRAAEYQTTEFEVSIPKLVRGPMDQSDNVEGDFKHCHYSRFVTAVGADGHLYPCPQVHLNERYRIGDVVDLGYETVLSGGPREVWEASNPMRTDLCKTCFYRPQNELLELLKRGDIQLEEALRGYQLAVPDTLHADFV
ncbi:radical SAM protein [Bradyrhizobium sp. 21]|uniref:radical SAM protein n=1 Tax=Bradyrhizobium sp. 21 TaxID=2782666 RepID=UPI001FF95D42|nr:radical SAM protein [Bradyrhizobium sp. 21]MCK1384089.1 radical SAM protein [Bradyrhizobium sp. 21]